MSVELCRISTHSDSGFPCSDRPLMASSRSPTCSAPVLSAKPPGHGKKGARFKFLSHNEFIEIIEK